MATLSVATLAQLETPKNLPDGIVSLLQALEIEEIGYDLNGGGDSGEAVLEHVRYRAGNGERDLPDLPIGISGMNAVITLGNWLDQFASDLPDGNWYDNEGGYGTVTILPFEPDPEDRVDCDMTYRDEYEDEDGDLDDEPDDAGALPEGFDVAGEAEDLIEGAGDCITIIGEVQP